MESTFLVILAQAVRREAANSEYKNMTKETKNWKLGTC